ncbi:HAUS augmin-like complex subunit 5 [Aplysia californica]|uniref:HAUS augmin-like complex subunit 5 n=1 Tax=Aplysia californica TaxID=6500 RepID=A0ABM1W127_APLCA|nr:HAUS augmin-like complex subunit 5 [Aplysia californica]
MTDHVEPHEALMAWARDEMKFYASTSSGTRTLPVEQDFKELFKGPLSDMWLYVLKHVRSVQTVKKIRGNLAVQKHLAQTKSDGSSEREKLLRERSRLSAELAACQSDVAMLQGEMERVGCDITDTERSYQSECQRVRDLQKKDSLLHVVRDGAEENVARYAEYSRRVSQRAEEVLGKRSNTSDTTYAMEQVKGVGGEMETESCRDVRITCEDIGKFLMEALNGELPDRSSLETAKSNLSQRVESRVSPHCAGTLVSALTSNTLSAAHRMREDTISLNIAKDVQDLSFSYGSKGLKDLSDPPTVQKSVSQLLQASNMEHIMRFYKEQEHKNESWKLEAQLDEIVSEIHKHINRAFGGHPDGVALAREYVDSLISLAAERSVMPCLKGELDDLTARRHKAKRDKEELREKFARIQNFRALVEKKQSVIGVLAKQNSGAPDRLRDQRQQVLKYITERSMASHVTEVRTLSDGLRNSLSAEVEKFSQLLLPCLLAVNLDSTTRRCVLDLSLAPSLHPVSFEKSQFHCGVCSTLGFPVFKSVDCLPDHVLHMQRQIQRLHFHQRRSQSFVEAAREAAGAGDDVDAILVISLHAAALCEEVRGHEEKQKEKLLPQLQTSINRATSHTAGVDKFKRLVANWWEQPAQLLTPWVVTEGLTFDQWMRRWRTAVTQVHKKMIQNQKLQKSKQ